MCVGVRNVHTVPAHLVVADNEHLIVAAIYEALDVAALIRDEDTDSVTTEPFLDLALPILRATAIQ